MNLKNSRVYEADEPDDNYYFERMFSFSNSIANPDCLIVRALVPMDILSCFYFLVLPFSQDK